MSDSKRLVYAGALKGHRGWVTALACPPTTDTQVKLLSASRDKTLVAWKENKARVNLEEDPIFVPERRLEGHSNFVSDVALSNTGDYAMSASWDNSLRLWNLRNGETAYKFLGHTEEVFAVAFSYDNRQIVSAGRDHQLKVWNVQGKCLFTVDKESDKHKSWITSVRYSPANSNPLIVTGSMDNTVKVWDPNDSFKCRHTLYGHTNTVTSVSISPDGSLCASGSTDHSVRLWDLEKGESLYDLDCKARVNQLCFSPNHYWLCAATEEQVIVFDLENKERIVELKPAEVEGIKAVPRCVSLCWSADGSVLYTGYTDNVIRVWNVVDNQ